MPLKPTERLGAKKFYAANMATRLGNTVGSIVAIYDFSVLGGAVGTVNLKDLDGNDAVLPKGAVVRDGFIRILTACASTGGTGTIALTANSAADLKAAVDADTLSGNVAIIPVGTAATAITLTADRTLTCTIATAALTAGKFELHVDFSYGSDVVG
jgi:hypothetical protein